MHLPKAHIHDLFVRYFSNKELDELYISFFFKSFAEAMISIFIPIYLLTLGFNIVDVMVYYLVYYIALIIAMFPGMWFSSRLGIKKTIAFGTILLTVFYYFINNIAPGIPFYFLAKVFWEQVWVSIMLLSILSSLNLLSGKKKVVIFLS